MTRWLAEESGGGVQPVPFTVGRKVEPGGIETGCKAPLMTLTRVQLVLACKKDERRKNTEEVNVLLKSKRVISLVSPVRQYEHTL